MKLTIIVRVSIQLLSKSVVTAAAQTNRLIRQ